MKDKLIDVQQWAREKLQGGSEPPWAWYQYMKLNETIDAILAGMEAKTTESSQQSAQRPGTHLRLVEGSDQQDTSPHRHDHVPVPLPM
ncbi:MAG: hypothetical protein OXF79_04460 [Chloroflexi bacterium]|nr:hypothetical protein [Chloroflexota bacterium]